MRVPAHVHVPHPPDADRVPEVMRMPIMIGGVLASGAALAVRFGVWVVSERLRETRHPQRR